MALRDQINAALRRNQQYRRSLLVPEWAEEGEKAEPPRVYYYPVSLADQKQADNLASGYEDEPHHADRAAAMICIKLLDDNDQRLFQDGDYPTLLHTDSGMATRILREINIGIDYTEKVEVKKPSSNKTECADSISPLPSTGNDQ